jgi:hypothetical protein
MFDLEYRDREVQQDVVVYNASCVPGRELCGSITSALAQAAIGQAVAFALFSSAFLGSSCTL